MTRTQPSMETAAEPADFAANALPLDPGVHLLEASAGTGKTFALAHLVLRLVGERQLSLRQLLVVTFTEAAAAELKDRIGRRLQQALRGLDIPALPSLDADLQLWLERWHPDERPQLRARLLLALEELDGADITTIHGFCRRILRRQALEAGLGPEVELEGEDATLLEQIVHDYWQQQLLPLPAHLLEGLVTRGLKREMLQDLLGSLEGDPALRPPLLPEGLSADQLLPEPLIGLWDASWRRFRDLWQERGEALYQALKDAPAHWKTLGAKPCSDYPAHPSKDRAQALNAWLAGQDLPGSYAAVLEKKSSWLPDYFHPGAFSKVAARLEGAEPSLPERELMEAVAALVDGPAEAVLAHFCHWGVGELERRRRRTGRMGFGDLLQGLDPGPDGLERSDLLASVQERYAVALIDEFQDTDPIQWRILRQAFCPAAAPDSRPEASAAKRHLLVMVGDPKQAIYRFRGGDLGTYLTARTMADVTHRLSRNFRSSAGLLTALNRLMQPGLKRSGLLVPPVVASRGTGRDELVLPEGEEALQLLWLGGERAAGDKPLSRSQLESVLPERVSALVLALLRRGLRLQRGEGHRPLEPADICLLVSRHDQAEALRLALERRGIASRLVSKGDVFEAEGAAVLQRLLDALAEPGSEHRQRLLAASPLLGWSPRQLATASAADWDALAERLGRLAASLSANGLLAALGDLLRGEDLARLSLSGRLLADLQQCAELVQERLHQERIGPAAAAAWLRRRRLHPPLSVPGDHQPHSDAVESAVGVVTVHRSKGLEFPVVICPYLWQVSGGAPSRGAGKRPWRRWTPPGETEPRLDLHLDPFWGEGLASSRQEREALDAESERLAYVAVTRAMELLVLCFGPAEGQAVNPLHPWLFAGEPSPDRGDDRDPYRSLSDADWLERLRGEVASRSLPLRLITADPDLSARARWQAPPQPGALETGPVPTWRLSSGWGRSSYSSWTHGSGGGLGPEALEEGRETDALAELDPLAVGPPDLAAASWSALGPLATFPRGAGAGDCLHRILERVDHRQPGSSQAHAELVRRELERAGLPTEQGAPVLVFLEQLRLTPMGAALGGFRLADLAPERCLNEMQFDLPLATGDEPAGAPAAGDRRQLVRAEELARVFREHPGGRFGVSYADQLADLPVASRGFLTGSIDLVFTAPDARGRTRWWVADWKSNWLGVRGDDGQPLACGPLHYGQEAMAALMAGHHYPLQAHLYLVALHRYLRWRLPGYRPERDLGGYVYLFLRGVPGPLRPPPGLSMREMAVPGVFVEPVTLPRLAALDALLREGQP